MHKLLSEPQSILGATEPAQARLRINKDYVSQVQTWVHAQCPFSATGSSDHAQQRGARSTDETGH